MLITGSGNFKVSGKKCLLFTGLEGLNLQLKNLAKYQIHTRGLILMHDIIIRPFNQYNNGH